MGTRREFFRYVIYDDDGSEILTVTNDPEGENPYLYVPEMPVRRVKILDGTASISTLTVRILDRRIVPSDQATGFATAAMQATWPGTGESYNRLLGKKAELYRRFGDEPEELAFRGRITSTALRSATTLEIQQKDARAGEKVRLWDAVFGYAESASAPNQPIAQLGAVLFHRYSHAYGATWGDWQPSIWAGIGRPSAVETFWVPTKVRIVNGGHHLEVQEGNPNVAGLDPILSAGSIDQWVGRAEVVVARKVGDEWVLSRPLKLAGYLRGRHPQVVCAPGDLLSPEWVSPPRGDDPPAWDRRFIIRAAGPVSRENPLLVGGVSGVHPATLLRAIWSGMFSASSPEIEFDEEALDRLERDCDPATGEPLAFPLPRLWFRITEPAEMIEWVEEHLFRPFGLWPVITPDGKVSVRSLLKRLPGPEEPAPLRLEKKHVFSASWGQDAEKALNLVEYTVQTAVPNSRSADGIEVVQTRVAFPHESVEVLGVRGKQEVAATGFWIPQPYDANELEHNVNAFVRPWFQPQAAARFRIAGWGPYEATVSVPKRIGAELEPYQVREGDIVDIELDVLPNLETGRRGLTGRFLVLEQRENRNSVELRLAKVGDYEAPPVSEEPGEVSIASWRFVPFVLPGEEVYLPGSGVEGALVLETEVEEGEVDYVEVQLATGGRDEPPDTWEGAVKAAPVGEFRVYLGELGEATDLTPNRWNVAAWENAGSNYWIRVRPVRGNQKGDWVVCSAPIRRLGWPVREVPWVADLTRLERTRLELRREASQDGTYDVFLSYRVPGKTPETPRGHSVLLRILTAVYSSPSLANLLSQSGIRFDLLYGEADEFGLWKRIDVEDPEDIDAGEIKIAEGVEADECVHVLATLLTAEYEDGPADAVHVVAPVPAPAEPVLWAYDGDFAEDGAFLRVPQPAQETQQHESYDYSVALAPVGQEPAEEDFQVEVSGVTGEISRFSIGDVLGYELDDPQTPVPISWDEGEAAWVRIRRRLTEGWVEWWRVHPEPILYLRKPTLAIGFEEDGRPTISFFAPDAPTTPRGDQVYVELEYGVSGSESPPDVWNVLPIQPAEGIVVLQGAVPSGSFVFARARAITIEGEDRPSGWQTAVAQYQGEQHGPVIEPLGFGVRVSWNQKELAWDRIVDLRVASEYPIEIQLSVTDTDAAPGDWEPGSNAPVEESQDGTVEVRSPIELWIGSAEIWNRYVWARVRPVDAEGEPLGDWVVLGPDFVSDQRPAHFFRHDPDAGDDCVRIDFDNIGSGADEHQYAIIVLPSWQSGLTATYPPPVTTRDRVVSFSVDDFVAPETWDEGEAVWLQVLLPEIGRVVWPIPVHYLERPQVSIDPTGGMLGWPALVWTPKSGEIAIEIEYALTDSADEPGEWPHRDVVGVALGLATLTEPGDGEFLHVRARTIPSGPRPWKDRPSPWAHVVLAPEG